MIDYTCDKEFNKFTHAVAAGVRKMKKKPRAFLFFVDEENSTYVGGPILGLKIFYLPKYFLTNIKLMENDIEIIPLFADEDLEVDLVDKFIKGYLEELETKGV